MSQDYQELIWRLEPDSNIVRTYPNATIVVYAAGTTTPIVWSGNADQYGVVNIASLPTGWYDIYVGGLFYKSLNHVTAAYAMKLPELWVSKVTGTISVDVNEDENHALFYTAVAGKILKVTVIAQYVDAAGDAYVHILKGASSRASALAFATDSIWSVRCYPLAAVYGWVHNVPAANLAIEAAKTVTIGINYVTGTLKGVTVAMLFKAD
jgi:hypothetical protein